MKQMRITMKKTILVVLVWALMVTITTTAREHNGKSTPNKIGGPCEGCEAIYESPVRFEQLSNSTKLPDYSTAGSKIEISGIVYQRDGKTPAKDVVIYVYHTDQSGIYPTHGNEKGWGKRHGYIRGWVKTDQNGFYQFYTLKPKAYPNGKAAAHIHITVKEPDKNEYWIEDYLFADDPLLASSSSSNPRGGSGVLTLSPPDKGISHATRHIILGLNIPDYPYSGLPELTSGLIVGSPCPVFDPLHLSGADKGKKVCPMCKYGYGQGIMIWFNHANLDHMSEFIKTLEAEMRKQGEKNLRVFLIYMNPLYQQNATDTEHKMMERKIKEWCEEQQLEKVAMTLIPSPVDEETAGVYQINPAAKNTIFVYKGRRITAKWVNVEYDQQILKTILSTL
jgi:protocatechuate 3,4-dioxygenase beta subunit